MEYVKRRPNVNWSYRALCCIVGSTVTQGQEFESWDRLIRRSNRIGGRDPIELLVIGAYAVRSGYPRRANSGIANPHAIRPRLSAVMVGSGE
ncbi:hypothetical protein FA13DRAFT_1740682 [Coprinellus micaceus]|uniref:Uncharacterized protein n=1 Tax=Coprinellus micaceus TaxID=71717 RepID=A0A4Y7SMC6_COPMI|nr:hypothetical protein FA13DRAFT_1740682 [Coprinellus micaceus]